jgi:hypothetical protein
MTPGAGRYNTQMEITLTQLEEAINYWRILRPSQGEAYALSAEVNALATVYAVMIFNHLKTVQLDTLPESAQQLLETWQKAA